VWLDKYYLVGYDNILCGEVSTVLWDMTTYCVVR